MMFNIKIHKNIFTSFSIVACFVLGFPFALSVLADDSVSTSTLTSGTTPSSNTSDEDDVVSESELIASSTLPTDPLSAGILDVSSQASSSVETSEEVIDGVKQSDEIAVEEKKVEDVVSDLKKANEALSLSALEDIVEKKEIIVEEKKKYNEIKWKPDSAPASGVAIMIKGNGDTKIDTSSLEFSLPKGAGELEMYVLPSECFGDLSYIKKNILSSPYCGESSGFAVNRPSDYSWKIKQDERIVLGFCSSVDIDCSDHPESFKVIFISDEILGPVFNPGHYQLSIHQ